jgi:four helix bundle protein
MTVIRKFEDLVAWQESRKLVRLVYAVVAADSIRRDYGLCDQLRRAAVSTMANVAEGFDCESRIEFAHFLTIARRSSVEVQSLLYAALDTDQISKTVFDSTYAQAIRVQRVIHSLKLSLNR